ncbi:MAG: T9SS type A sorting domain-containing protein [Ignavibacteriales bacterium]|nr:T9SS type A sorting domain-containing protein [Ignavibacteriales bacterium]
MRSINLLMLLVSSTLITAQDFRSTHQVESSYYLQNSIFNKPYVKQASSTSLKKNTEAKLNKTVLGFLPWWEYKLGTHKNLRYDLLSHIAVFSFEADSLGNLKDPLNWPWIDLINTVADKNVKLMITITNFNPDNIHKLMIDIGVRRKLLENIRTRLLTYNLSGVIIDFENIRDSDKEFAVRNFLDELRKNLNSATFSYEIAFATPAVSFGKWVFPNILEYADYLFIMGYDFYGSWSSTTGPSAPLTGGFFNLTKSLNEDYSNVPSNKLILGVPYYGNYWKTKSKEAYATVTPYDSMSATNNWVKPALRYGEIVSSYNQKEKLFDGISKTPWLRWQDTAWNQIWYDDSVSLELKYDLAINKNLKGVGIWALGYDDGRTELWNLIERKFKTVVSSNIPVSFKLYQNYPNPFNLSTIISWQLAVSSFVNLKIYDLLGREVATLVDEYKPAGVYVETLHATSLPSGVYFYRISAGDYVQTKKMLVLK